MFDEHVGIKKCSHNIMATILRDCSNSILVTGVALLGPDGVT
jgi:hypothetical protein